MPSKTAAGSPTTIWVASDCILSKLDIYYDYLEQEILARSEIWAQKVLLVRATIAYLIRHSTGRSVSTPTYNRSYESDLRTSQ